MVALIVQPWSFDCGSSTFFSFISRDHTFIYSFFSSSFSTRVREVRMCDDRIMLVLLIHCKRFDCVVVIFHMWSLIFIHLSVFFYLSMLVAVLCCTGFDHRVSTGLQSRITDFFFSKSNSTKMKFFFQRIFNYVFPTNFIQQKMRLI